MTTPINLKSDSIGATTSTGNKAYPNIGGAPGRIAAYLYNAGSVPVFVKSGSSTVQATTTDTFIPPGQTRLLLKDPNDTHIAAITASSTATLYYQEADSN